MKKTKLALCQIKPSFDTDETVARAIKMVETCADNGAELILFPEMFYYPYDLLKIKSVIGKENKYLEMLCNAASANSVYINTGSMAIVNEGKVFNRSHFIGSDGRILGEYSKCHLFDAFINNSTISESALFTGGNSLTVIDTPLCKIGILICFDIRFPEMARLYALNGVELLLVPSVFNNVTGPAHWHTMLCSRAIENQFFVAATSQARHPDCSYSAYGHSLVAGPWGEVLCEASDGEEVLYCTIDPALIEKAKNRLQLLSLRRKDIYNLSLNDLNRPEKRVEI